MRRSATILSRQFVTATVLIAALAAVVWAGFALDAAYHPDTSATRLPTPDGKPWWQDR